MTKLAAQECGLLPLCNLADDVRITASKRLAKLKANGQEIESTWKEREELSGWIGCHPKRENIAGVRQ